MREEPQKRKSLSERLYEEQARLKARLAAIDAVLEAAQSNPESQQLLDRIGKLGFV